MSSPCSKTDKGVIDTSFKFSEARLVYGKLWRKGQLVQENRGNGRDGVSVVYGRDKEGKIRAGKSRQEKHMKGTLRKDRGKGMNAKEK